MLRVRRIGGFTLIEMLTVVTIIMIVMALALPNFVAMMKERKWSVAISNIQGMVMRARALATNVRKDFSVEFNIRGDNGTVMWLESEENDLERTPDLWQLEHEIGGYPAIRYFMITTFYNSGGRYKYYPAYYECLCVRCGWQWKSPAEGGLSVCPKCGVNDYHYRPMYTQYYYDIEYHPELTRPDQYGDNARQSEDVVLRSGITVDLAASRYFFSWDSPNSVECYGGDLYPDIRIGTNGALVQTLDPVICLKETRGGERRAVTVVRCTGRVVPARVP